jgi:hypothetical protein
LYMIKMSEHHYFCFGFSRKSCVQYFGDYIDAASVLQDLN